MLQPKSFEGTTKEATENIVSGKPTRIFLGKNTDIVEDKSSFQAPVVIENGEDLSKISCKEIKDYALSIIPPELLSNTDIKHRKVKTCFIVKFFLPDRIIIKLNKDIIQDYNLILFMNSIDYNYKEGFLLKVMTKVATILDKEMPHRNSLDINDFIINNTKFPPMFIVDNRYRGSLEGNRITMFSLYMIVKYIMKKSQMICSSLQLFSNNEGGNWLFYIMIKTSRNTFDLIEEGYLNKEANKQSLFPVCEDCFMSMMGSVVDYVLQRKTIEKVKVVDKLIRRSKKEYMKKKHL